MITTSEFETQMFGREFAKHLKPGALVALHGDLGAGKTTFVKGMMGSLADISEREVQSPTFTYLHVYEGNTFSIYHFDLYRLKDSAAFVQMGFLDYLHDEGICIIEWAEKIAPHLPPYTLHIKLSHLEEGKRRIDVL